MCVSKDIVERQLSNFFDKKNMIKFDIEYFGSS